ncbi:Uncharacterized protein (Fragment) [Durusdinium trenchii]|uniref:Uncharacterized protein n=1 Tax=Durusdinium trenchii TaxID=1381693 RepID=A0ABP0IL51_9DINO
MQTEELRQIRVGINEAFCDGVNSGFYVNSYTTKPGPALAGMLEELRKGIERLEAERHMREEERSAAEKRARDAGLDDVVLQGWRKVAREDELLREIQYVYIGPQGQQCADLYTAYEEYQGAHLSKRRPEHKPTIMQELLTLHAVQEKVLPTDTEGSDPSSNLRALIWQSHPANALQLEEGGTGDPPRATDQRADLLGGIRASQGKQDDPKTTEEETNREDGKKLPTPLWRKFQGRSAKDAEPGFPDPRFFEDKFRYGYCMSIYWSSLARMLSHRAVLDAKELQVPLVMLQAADECCDLKQDAAFRFLNMTNPNKTGHMHGMFPCHVGMDIRFLAKLDGDAGMVQDTQAKIIDFEFHSLDREAYRQTAPGDMFYPRFLPSGLWVSVKEYSGCPDWEELQEMCRKHVQTDEEACKLAKSFWFLPAVEVKVLFSSTQKHEVRRCGLQVTHAQCLTSTASQGLTLRTGTIVDCARLPELDDDNWWLHLYVMFSRVTSLDDLLLLRPPPREILERGPPESIVARVAEFQKRAERCRDGALRLREQWDVRVGQALYLGAARPARPVGRAVGAEELSQTADLRSTAKYCLQIRSPLESTAGQMPLRQMPLRTCDADEHSIFSQMRSHLESTVRQYMKLFYLSKARMMC